jgi:hypothetical protein
MITFASVGAGFVFALQVISLAALVGVGFSVGVQGANDLYKGAKEKIKGINLKKIGDRAKETATKVRNSVKRSPSEAPEAAPA